jgi:hypothetical protein
VAEIEPTLASRNLRRSVLVQSLVWIAVKAHCTGLAGDFCG